MDSGPRSSRKADGGTAWTGVWYRSREVTERRLARLPDDGGHLVGIEGPHRVRADVAERPSLKHSRHPRLIVGELGNDDDVVLADRPERFPYPAAFVFDELDEILRATRRVLVVLDALVGPVDQRHIGWHARHPPLGACTDQIILYPGRRRG